MLYSHNYFRWRGREGDGADREGAGDGNEALFINLLCKQHYIGLSDGMWEGGGNGEEANGGARRVSSPFNHDRSLALIMLSLLRSARAKTLCFTAEGTSGFVTKLAFMLTDEWEKSHYPHLMFASACGHEDTLKRYEFIINGEREV